MLSYPQNISRNKSKILEKYIIDRWRKQERKTNLKRVVAIKTTDDILKFNILSRKATQLTSKGATKEAMEYLLDEFTRIEKKSRHHIIIRKYNYT